MTKLLQVQLGVACLLAAGCASVPRPNLFSDSDPPSSELLVIIRNESPSARDIYAIWEGGNRDWLGMVPGETTQTFSITYRTGAIRFSGGPRVFVAVYPGDRVEMYFPRAGAILPPRRIRSPN